MVYVGLSESKLSGTIRYENITVEQFDRMRIELAKIFGEDGIKVTDKPFRYCRGYAGIIREKRIERGMSVRALAKASQKNFSVSLTGAQYSVPDKETGSGRRFVSVFPFGVIGISLS